MEILFDDLSANDRVVIRTQNSEYRFDVTEPSEHKGVLSGGTLGKQGREAVLVGALSEGDARFLSESPKLAVGARALFYLKAKNGVERLITSVIADIGRLNGRERVEDRNNRRAA